MKYVLILLSLFALMACGGGRGDTSVADFDSTVFQPRYAAGFRIMGAPGRHSMIIETSVPWQGADSSDACRILVLTEGETVPEGFTGQVLAGVPRRIAAMSTSHVAMLTMLGEAERVCALSGKKFVCDSRVRARFADIAEVGYEGNIDYEALVAAQPDIVLLYGINGPNTAQTRLDELGIPYMYIGEYVENHPLGKAEWIYAPAVLLGVRNAADSAFSMVEERYNHLKDSVSALSDRPGVMINTPYGGIWYVPSSDSYVVRMISDAGGLYMPERCGLAPSGSASGTVDTEQAYALMSQCDIWLHPGQLNTLGELAQACPGFTSTPPFRNGRVFNNNRRSSAAGGNDYYESGVVRPDLILKDLIEIFHADSLGTDVYYHHRLK